MDYSAETCLQAHSVAIVSMLFNMSFGWNKLQVGTWVMTEKRNKIVDSKLLKSWFEKNQKKSYENVMYCDIHSLVTHWVCLGSLAQWQVPSRVAPSEERGPAVIMKTEVIHARECFPVKKLLSLFIIQRTNRYRCSLLGSITTQLTGTLWLYAHQALQLYNRPTQSPMGGVKFIFLC